MRKMLRTIISAMAIAAPIGQFWATEELVAHRVADEFALPPSQQRRITYSPVIGMNTSSDAGHESGQRQRDGDLAERP